MEVLCIRENTSGGLFPNGRTRFQGNTKRKDGKNWMIFCCKNNIARGIPITGPRLLKKVPNINVRERKKK
jgi:hypothetical protein